MAWQVINNIAYYYRRFREGGRVRAAYVGPGERGEAAERADALARLARQAERAERLCRRADAAELADALDELADAACAAAAQAIEAAGYHKHKREWRRAMPRVEYHELTLPAAGSIPPPPPAAPAGPGKCLDGMVRALAAHMAAGLAGDTDKASNEEMFMDEALAFAAELAGPGASPVERALAETAALSWMALRLTEAAALAHFKQDAVRPAQAEQRQRLLNRTTTRYTNVLRTLATVRRLAPPGQATQSGPPPEAAEDPLADVKRILRGRGGKLPPGNGKPKG